MEQNLLPRYARAITRQNIKDQDMAWLIEQLDNMYWHRPLYRRILTHWLKQTLGMPYPEKIEDAITSLSDTKLAEFVEMVKQAVMA